MIPVEKITMTTIIGKEPEILPLPVGSLPEGSEVRKVVDKITTTLFDATGIPGSVWTADYEDSSKMLTLHANLDYLDNAELKTMMTLAEETSTTGFSIFDARDLKNPDATGVRPTFIWSLSEEDAIRKLDNALMQVNMPYEQVQILKTTFAQMTAISKDVQSVLVNSLLTKLQKIGDFDAVVVDNTSIELLDFVKGLCNEGLKVSVLKEFDVTEAFPPVLLLFRMPGSGVKSTVFTELFSRRIHMINPLMSTMFAENRYNCYRTLEKVKGINIPKTRYFESEDGSHDKLRAFLQEHPDQTFAVKEHIHRGGGRTPFQLKGLPTREQEHILLRCETDYPLSLQEWIDHDPMIDYIRMITVGENQFAKVPSAPASESLLHAQESSSFTTFRDIPESVREQGFRVNEVLNLEFNSTDYIQGKDGTWYTLDVQAERTDQLDYLKLEEKDRYIKAWAELIRKHSRR